MVSPRALHRRAGVMRSSAVRWLAALVITAAAAVWQERSGPTYPVRGSVTLGGARIAFELARSHGGEGDQPVRVRVADAAVRGDIAWRRFPSTEQWQVLPLQRRGEWLQAALPHQPPAGKLAYQVRLERANEWAIFPKAPAITRFKGAVPTLALAPHILLMFLGMLCSTRAGLEALAAGGRAHPLAWLTLALFAAGGFILGPVVQRYAFGAWWTGIPFGWDLTDNKALALGLAWGFAAWAGRGGRRARWAVIAAAVVTLAVFAIPHSVWGSEIDWTKLPLPPR